MYLYKKTNHPSINLRLNNKYKKYTIDCLLFLAYGIPKKDGEIFVDIKGYEKIYAISNYGNVWSYKMHRFIVAQLNYEGYPQIGLYKDNKTKRFLYID
jgi:hypothetical protein